MLIFCAMDPSVCRSGNGDVTQISTWRDHISQTTYVLPSSNNKQDSLILLGFVEKFSAVLLLVLGITPARRPRPERNRYRLPAEGLQ